jgi:hypothetical protein
MASRCGSVWLRSLAAGQNFRFLAILVLVVGLSSGNRADAFQRVVKNVHNTSTLLDQLIIYGYVHKQGIGIVLGSDNALCQSLSPTESENVQAELRLRLDQANYAMSENDQVLAVRPKLVSPEAKRILALRWKQFGGGFRTTLQGHGIALESWIRAERHPTQGIAGSIPSSLDAEQFSLPLMRDASVEEIGNRIISSGSKGVWFLYQRDRNSSELTFRSFGYKEERLVLRHACESLY